MKKNETILKVGTCAITGASGFIGQHLADALVSQGKRVLVLVHRQDVPGQSEKFYGSLRDPDFLRGFLRGADTLFHLAAAMGNRVLPEADFFRINDDETRVLLEVAVACGVRRVIHFSSAGVYGMNSGVLPLAETAPLHPVDRYERSKLAGEKTALSFADRLALTVIRPGWVYGEGDRRTFKLIRQIQSGYFAVIGSGRIRHSPIHVDDVARGALAAANGATRSGEIYNLGGPALSVCEMVAAIAHALGRRRPRLKVPVLFAAPLARMLDGLYSPFGREAPLGRSKLAFFLRGKPIDSSKIERELGFRPKIDLASGLARSIAWYRERGWL